jgi:hypothetical protein
MAGVKRKPCEDYRFARQETRRGMARQSTRACGPHGGAWRRGEAERMLHGEGCADAQQRRDRNRQSGRSIQGA